MNLLLDTHVLLWWLDDPTLLSEQALASIKDTNNKVIVSVVSAWEIAIKKTLGKLEAPDNLKQMIADAGFVLMPNLCKKCISFKFYYYDMRCIYV